MRILVSDTSVLIDLERGAFLESCFNLPFEFAVPDLLYARELEAYGGPALVARGLRVEGLTGESRRRDLHVDWHFFGRIPCHDQWRYARDCGGQAFLDRLRQDSAIDSQRIEEIRPFRGWHRHQSRLLHGHPAHGGNARL